MWTTALILLPLVGALVVAILPLPRESTAGLAFLVALAEIALWVAALGRFDFDDGGLQLGTSREWVESLGISYSVGFYGFSLWLVGATVVVFAAAIGYAMWVGRDRSRAYHALMLFLLGAVVATFAAQDLLLFYVSFEAMLIPLYVLVGVWGGERRQAATVTFVIYTMAGSLLMLASVVAFGVTQGTFSLTESGTSDNVWIFLGFAIAFAVKAPLFPFHGWLPLAYRESPVEVAAVLSAIVSKTAIYGFLRIGIPKFPEPADDLSGLILVLACAGLVYGSLLAFRAPDLRGVIAYSSMAQMGLITIGVFAFDDLGLDGADPAVGRPRARLREHVPARRDGREALRDERHRRAGRDGARSADAGDGRPRRGDDRARGARLGDLRRRVPDHGRRLRAGLGLLRGRRARDRARCDVHAARDLGDPAREARDAPCARRRSTCGPASSRSCSRCS